MSPLQTDDANRWVRQIQDAIADNSALREGLEDDEALPLVEWGAQQACYIGARLAASTAPPPTEEQVAETAYTLTRLMTRVTWLAVYRHKKDAAWLTRTFQMINQLSHELYGPTAPTFSDDEIAAWIAGHVGRSNGELIRELIARLTPASSLTTPDDPPVSAASDHTHPTQGETEDD